MKHFLTVSFVLLSILVYSQKVWTSPKYHYYLEIPKGFQISQPIGANVDFKAVNGTGTIVIVVKTFPPDVKKQFEGKTIFDMLGDLKSYEVDWIKGAKEYLTSPTFVKSGKTSIAKIPTYWMDFTTDRKGTNTLLYNKMYQFQLNSILYTFTLTCDQTELANFQPIWFRFINSYKISTN